MQIRLFRGLGEPVWVNALSSACERLGPDPRRALGPAATRCWRADPPLAISRRWRHRKSCPSLARNAGADAHGAADLHAGIAAFNLDEARAVFSA